MSSALLEPVHSIDDVDAAQQEVLAALGRELHGAATTGAPPSTRARGARSRPRRPSSRRRAGAGAWPRRSRGPGFANRRSAIRVSSPTVPAPITSTEPPSGTCARSAVWIAHASGSISTARLVAHARRDRPQLRAVREHQPAPAAAGVAAVAGLQPGLEVAHRHAVAAAVLAGRAVRAELGEPARRAAEHRRQDHAGAGLQVVAVVEQLAHDLVARHERQRHERREVEGRLARRASRGRSRRCPTAAASRAPIRRARARGRAGSRGGAARAARPPGRAPCRPTVRAVR